MTDERIDVLAVMRADAEHAFSFRNQHDELVVWKPAMESMEAQKLVAELIAVLQLARDELGGLPRSLGYDFTHLPKIDALLARIGGQP